VPGAKVSTRESGSAASSRRRLLACGSSVPCTVRRPPPNLRLVGSICTRCPATTSLVGLTVLLVRFQPVFEAVRVAGAAYLLWLAFQLLRSAARRKVHGSAAGTASVRPRSVAAAFRAGFLCNIGNPKAAVFFSSVFAALLPPHVDWEYRTAIGVAIPAVGVAWYVLVACLFSAKRIAAAYARARRVVDAVTGTLFAVLAGDLLVTE